MLKTKGKSYFFLEASTYYNYECVVHTGQSDFQVKVNQPNAV